MAITVVTEVGVLTYLKIIVLEKKWMGMAYLTHNCHVIHFPEKWNGLARGGRGSKMSPPSIPTAEVNVISYIYIYNMIKSS